MLVDSPRVSILSYSLPHNNMLPRLLDDNERDQERIPPSLPGIHELFEDLARPTSKLLPSSSIPRRSSPFSLADLNSSLPANSRPPSLVESQGWPSPRSIWSQGSDHGAESHSPKLLFDTSSAPPSTSSTQDQFLMVPGDFPGHKAEWRLTSSSGRVYESHNRSRSISDAIATRESSDSQILGDISLRRHTIGSGRVTSHVDLREVAEFIYKPTVTVPSRSTSDLQIGPPYAVQESITDQYTSRSAPIRMRGSRSVLDNSLASSAPSRSPPIFGEDVPVVRRKSPARYQCQVCGKRFNRPSSLKIHHNTHTGEKPFPCLFPGCGRNFSVLSNMRRHARIHGNTYIRQAREGSAEEIPDMPSPSYSSTSSTHATPVISNSSAPHSYPSSVSSSPGLYDSLNLPSSSHQKNLRRHSTIPRSYPYNVSASLSSDDECSSFE